MVLRERLELGWRFGRDPLPDYGVDALAEVVGNDNLVTGRLPGIQVKGSERSGSAGSAAPAGLSATMTTTLAYWLSYSVPVIVVLVNKQREAFWQAVTPETVTERGIGSSDGSVAPAVRRNRAGRAAGPGHGKGADAGVAAAHAVSP